MEGYKAFRGIVPDDVSAALACGKGGIVVLEVYQGFPEGGVFIGGPICNRVFLKEGQTAVQAYFLAGVNEWLAAGEGETKYRTGIGGSAFALEFSAGPGVFVVVGCEGEAVCFLGEAAGVTGYVVLQVFHGFAAAGQAVKQVMEFPGVVCVKCYGGVCKVVAFCLCKEVDFRVVGVHFGKDSVPEVCGDFTGGVAAEAVYAFFQPETHGIVLGPPYFFVFIVEGAGVGPVVFPDGIAKGVALVEVGRLFCHPDVVRGGLVGDPVKDDFEALCMGGVKKALEVFHGSEFGVYFLVV